MSGSTSYAEEIIELRQRIAAGMIYEAFKKE